MKNKIDMILLLVLGIIIGSIGFINIYRTKDYIETTAIYSGTDKKENMHRLLYTYKVNDNTYTYETDYETNIIPIDGTKIKIKYDNNNYKRAVMKYSSTNGFLFFVSFLMLSISFLIYYENTKGSKKLYFSVLYLTSSFAGIIMYYMISVNNGTLNLITTFKTNGLDTFIPLLFIFIGLYAFVTNIILDGINKPKRIIDSK